MDHPEIRLRLAALDQAVKVVVSHEADGPEVLGLAERMYQWLMTPPVPTHLALVVGGPIKQNTPKEPDTVQIHDDEQFTLTVQATDAKGFAVTDPNLTWSVDNESVAVLQVSDDKQTATVVAGVPGSAVVTLTDGTLTVTEAVDVVPGGVALITLTEGTVQKQAVPQPPADGGDAPTETPVDPAPVEEPIDGAPEAPVTEDNPAGFPAV